ncbi:FimV/HubP family polar landmark protein [Stutzerimonas stutzeri]|uniref:FimV/HubP family polar landmark protein n=1 Tax=Stutzerimonas stutzeri TaxID=316 RepID=UPI001C2E94E0|nr:FimV/HubP family polar landmark protein [Stutzerimonas stutzeri]
MVRVRNLVLAIAAATALTSEMAYALGLGEVTLKSALNQPLVAEIELLDAKTLAPGEVVPVLASAEDFNRAGVDRQYFLTDLTFTPVLRPDGKSVIRVSSTKPVREPYLNFLIEVIWPSGRLLREYTLLLDPPLYSPEVAASVAPQLPIAAPVSRPAAPRAAPPAKQASAGASSQPGEQYKVTPNDTLWEIAERSRQGGTVHQTMLAIQDLNPNAFIGGNINRMKNGQVLRLPNAEQIGRRSQAEAIQQVAQQNASWRQTMGASPAGARQLDATQRGSAGAAPARSEQGDNLRLVAPEAGKSTAGGDAGAADESRALRDKLALTEESLDSSRRENLDLKDRLNDLQSQLDKLQRLMQLKDDQLAKLQAQLATGAESGAGAAAPSSPAEDSANETAAAPSTNQAASEPAVEAEAPAAAPAPEKPAEQVEKPAAKAPATPAPAAPVAPAPSPEPDSYIDELLGNPILLGVLGGSALLLLLVGLMALSRRNAMKEAELQESLLAEESPDAFYVAQHDLPASQVEPVDQGVAPVSEQAADPLAGVSSDPLAEADIYIAYGRFNQAADLLQNALNDEPQRSDLRLKLMEVYAELGDREGFARQEAELREIGGSSAEIDQVKARYPAMAAAAGAGFAAAASVGNDDFDTLNLDDLELDEPAPVSAESADNGFDLTLDDLELDDGLSDRSPAAAEDATSELETFNFDELDLETAPQASSEHDFSFDLDEPKSDSASLEDELSGFSLDLDDQPGVAIDEEPAASAQSPASEAFESTDDFDFGVSEPAQPAAMPDEFDLSLDDEAGEPARPEVFSSELEEVEAELDDLSRNLAEPLDQPTASEPLNEPAAPASEALDDDFDFFADTDETTTKLDLARAYIDMGDAEGARDILDEVMSEGSDSQQQEARDMLAKLA